MPSQLITFGTFAACIISQGCVRSKCDIQKSLDSDLDWNQRKARIEYRENAGPEIACPPGWQPTPTPTQPTPSTQLIPIPDPMFQTPRTKTANTF